jgi:hypothetical protein
MMMKHISYPWAPMMSLLGLQRHPQVSPRGQSTLPKDSIPWGYPW